MNWGRSGPVLLAAFLASLVECAEALTIVLAAGVTRGWRWALIGSGAGGLLLILLILAFGPSLQLMPLAPLRIGVGVLLLLFGLRWLHKAILRAAGIIGLHDEEKIFAKQIREMSSAGSGLRVAAFDGIAFITSFKAVVIEGLEVVFIVIAAGAAGGMLVPASVGAGAAALVIVFLGIVLHRPLTRIPENILKFSAGILLCAFGVFWIGEGVGVRWPGEDWSVLALAAGFFTFSALGVALGKRRLRHG